MNNKGLGATYYYSRFKSKEEVTECYKDLIEGLDRMSERHKPVEFKRREKDE